MTVWKKGTVTRNKRLQTILKNPRAFGIELTDEQKRVVELYNLDDLYRVSLLDKDRPSFAESLLAAADEHDRLHPQPAPTKKSRRMQQGMVTATA